MRPARSHPPKEGAALLNVALLVYELSDFLAGILHVAWPLRLTLVAAGFVPSAVLGFLVDHQDTFEVLTSSAFVWYENPEIVSRLIPSKSLKPLTAGGSIWIRKKA